MGLILTNTAIIDENLMFSLSFKLRLGQDNSAGLAKQIVFNPEKAIQTTKNAYGTKFSQVISVQGANGKIIDVVFIFIKNNDGVIRLVTSIPAKR